jgi:hypothetical protein
MQDDAPQQSNGFREVGRHCSIHAPLISRTKQHVPLPTRQQHAVRVGEQPVTLFFTERTQKP